MLPEKKMNLRYFTLNYKLDITTRFIYPNIANRRFILSLSFVNFFFYVSGFVNY